MIDAPGPMKEPGKHRIRRVCVVRFGGMGDILMTTPALREVARRCGTEQMDYIVARGNRDALTGIPYIQEVIEFGPRGKDMKTRNFLRFLARLRASRYDLFINFQPSVKTLLMQAAVSARHNLVFRKDRRPQSNGQVRHAIDDFLKELRPLGIPLETVTDRRMDFHIPEGAQQVVAERLRTLGIAEDDMIVVANPGGTREINRWPPPKYIELLDALAEEFPKAWFVLSGGPDDGERAAQIENGVGPTTKIINLARKLSMKETGALLARANVFVTVDTGPMHMASAIGTPMVVLSGAADPYRTGPTTSGDLVVIKRDLNCVPCGDRSCRRGDIACMHQMPMEWVLNAVRFRLRGPIPAGRAALTGIERVEPSGLIALERWTADPVSKNKPWK